MSSKRKTVSVAWLLATVNHRNRYSNSDPATREGWNSLLESALHHAGVYTGFHYLGPKDVPHGQKPGIVWHGEPSADCAREYPDESRRGYYVANCLADEYTKEFNQLRERFGDVSKENK